MNTYFHSAVGETSSAEGQQRQRRQQRELPKRKPRELLLAWFQVQLDDREPQRAQIYTGLGQQEASRTGTRSEGANQLFTIESGIIIVGFFLEMNRLARSLLTMRKSREIPVHI